MMRVSSHIFIKDYTDEDYTGFFQTTGCIEQATTLVCDSEEYCICTEISEDGDIRRNQGGYRKNIETTMPAKGN